MGWKDRNKKRPFGKRDRNKDQNEDNRGVRGSWQSTPILKENAAFEAYYKAQGIVPEGEWDAFMAALREELPHSFRLTGCRGEAKTKIMLDILQNRYFKKLEGAGEMDGYKIGPPETISWYPGGLGFQLNLPKKVVRKNPELRDLHTFLVAETEMGNVSRQETVSMIPPLFLQVRPHHRVLDMCAAPGSKTAQLVEALHDETLQPTGFVVANDSDNKRCYLLVHQSLKRLNNSACVVINHDAAVLPNLYREAGPGKGERKGLIRYDRILADVPCTGDGTQRKNFDVWRKWNIHDGISLHPLQLRIAKRGAELLDVGGRMVYSTCSLNPVEDEAVLAQLILWSGGALRLVDVSEDMPALKRVPGISTWKLMDRAGNIYERPEDVKDDKKGRLVPSLFPPPPEITAGLNLHRAFRILPHHQNTGGFFVAVLEKVKELVDKPSSEPSETETEGETTGGGEVGAKDGSESPAPKKSKPYFQGYREANFIFLKETDPQWLDIKSAYELSDDFPATQLLHRSQEGVQKRNLYLVNAAVKEILQTNYDYIKIINSGLRMFGRVEQKYELARFRLAQEGLENLFRYLGPKRCLQFPLEDLAGVLAAPRNASLRIDALSEEAQKLLTNLPEGSVALHATHQGNVMSVCAWRGKVTVSAYVEAPVKLHYLRLLGKDTSAIEEEIRAPQKPRKKKGAETESLGDDVTEESLPEASEEVGETGAEGKESKEEEATEDASTGPALSGTNCLFIMSPNSA